MTRRQELGLGSTANGGSGGSFAAHVREAAGPPPPRLHQPELVELTVPAREVRLLRGTPSTWPEGWDREDVNFGEDDSGRFFTSWTFSGPDGEEHHLTYTDFEEGADYSAEDIELPYDDPEAMDQFESSLKAAHNTLRTNSYSVGRAACENSPDLEQQVLDISLGPRNQEMTAAQKIAAAGIERPVTFTRMSAEAQAEWEQMQLERIAQFEFEWGQQQLRHLGNQH